MVWDGPELYVGISESLAGDFAAEELEVFVTSGARADVIRLADGPHASLELYLPTAVGVFVMGAFFTGFLKKAGEDAYQALKIGTKALYKKSASIAVRRVGTQGKVHDTGYSTAFAVGCELLSGTLRIKLLLHKDASLKDSEEAIEAFLNLMRDFHEGRVSEAEAKRLLVYPPCGGTLLMSFNRQVRAIVAVNGRDGSHGELPLKS